MSSAVLPTYQPYSLLLSSRNRRAWSPSPARRHFVVDASQALLPAKHTTQRKPVRTRSFQARPTALPPAAISSAKMSPIPSHAQMVRMHIESQRMNNHVIPPPALRSAIQILLLMEKRHHRNTPEGVICSKACVQRDIREAHSRRTPCQGRPRLPPRMRQCGGSVIAPHAAYAPFRRCAGMPKRRRADAARDAR